VSYYREFNFSIVPIWTVGNIFLLLPFATLVIGVAGILNVSLPYTITRAIGRLLHQMREWRAVWWRPIALNGLKLLLVLVSGTVGYLAGY